MRKEFDILDYDPGETVTLSTTYGETMTIELMDYFSADDEPNGVACIQFIEDGTLYSLDVADIKSIERADGTVVEYA